MNTFLIWVISLAVGIGAGLFYTFADYGIALLVTMVFVGCAWLWKES